MRITSIRKIHYDNPIPVYDMIEVLPTHNFMIALPGSNSAIVSHNCGLLDEIDFVPGADVKTEQSRIMKIYRNIKRRMESRFTRGGELAAMLFMVSSKKSESDALENHITAMKSDPKVIVIDEPIWHIKPKGTYKDEWFKVAVGNKYMKSKVVMPEDNLEVLKSQGYSFIDVPINFYNDFMRDVDTSLNDYAGISSSVSMKFIAYDRLVKCYSTLINPFSMSVISLGIYDRLQIKDFMDLSLVPDEIKSLPIFIHLDMSLTGDRTGISGVAILGTKFSQSLSNDNETPVKTRELMYRHVFSIGIQCPPGSEISLQKNREFIYYLSSQGFNIKGVSADGFQSADTRQQLITSGYKCDIISLDRTPEPYNTFKIAINEQRVQMIRLPELEDELINLNKDNVTNKIDHDSQHTKDISDSVAGALYNASKYKDQYLAYTTDDFEVINEVNTTEEISIDKVIPMESLITDNSPKSNPNNINTEILIPGEVPPQDLTNGSLNKENLTRSISPSHYVKFDPNILDW